MPTTISAANVLFGIAEPSCRILNPNDLSVVETISLSSPNLPSRWRFAPEGTERRVARSRRLRTNELGFRLTVTFDVRELDRTAAANWAKLYNYHIAGYTLLLTPHNDAALKIEYPMLPEGDFELGFLADKYLGHTGTFIFISVDLIPAVDVRSAINELRLLPIPYSG